MKKRKRLNFKRILTILLFIVAVIYSYNKFYMEPEENNSNKKILSILNIEDDSPYKIIKQDSNSKYSGAGQSKVKGKDGYFTTFTTCEPNKKTYLEYKQNGAPLGVIMNIGVAVWQKMGAE